MEWIEEQVRDGRILRLIRKWDVYHKLLEAYPLQRPYIAQPWAGGGGSGLRNRVR
jgi:hypothetical protein